MTVIHHDTPRARRRLVWAAVGVAAIAAAAWLGAGGSGEAAIDAAEPTSAASTAPHTTAAATPSAPLQAAASARPTDPARWFEVGFAGDLALTMDTAAALELVQAELGADPSAAEVARVEAMVRQGLPPAAADEAVALLRRHRAYSDAFAQDLARHPPADTLAEQRAQLARTEALQRKHFGDAGAQALYGLQWANTRHSLDVQAVQADAGRTPADKAARIAALRAALPPELAELQAEAEAEADESPATPASAAASADAVR